MWTTLKDILTPEAFQPPMWAEMSPLKYPCSQEDVQEEGNVQDEEEKHLLRRRSLCAAKKQEEEDEMI